MKEEIIEKENAIGKEESQYEEVKPISKEESQYEEIKPIKKEIRTDSYFDGNLLELIGWKLLAGLITIVTLGIGLPWATCMLYSYQIKHTVYNGKRLKFEGSGGDLFVNRFKWIFLSIITFGIYILFIPVKKIKWVISNIHFEDEDFITGESFFDGKTIQLIGTNILCSLLNLISFGLLIPFTRCYKIKWISKHTIINRKRLSFNGKAIQLWGKQLLWGLLSIITLGIYSWWLPIKKLKWQAKHTHIKVVGENEEKDKSLLYAIPILFVGIIIFSLIISGLVTMTSNIGTSGEFNLEEILENIGGSLNNNETNLKMPNEEIMNENPDISINIPDDNENETSQWQEENQPSQWQVEQQYVPEKQSSIVVNGYTLEFGTYKGQMEQGYWDEETMTSSSRFYDVILELDENNIYFEGQSGSYSFSGNNIVWNGADYMFEVVGDNKIRFNAETCPILEHQ